jgi:hypothetical protein
MPEIKTIADAESFADAKLILEGIPGALGRAGMRAANKTADSGKVYVARMLKKLMGPKATMAQIKKTIYVNRASKKWSAAQLKIQSRGITLRHFGAKQTPTGVSTTIGDYPHAFLAPPLYVKADGVKQVFWRIGEFRIQKRGRYKGKMREVIQVVRGMSQQELLRRFFGGGSDARAKMAELLPKYLANEVNYELLRVKK